MTNNYDWDTYYMAATLETDWRKMPSRVCTAEVAIRERQNQIAGADDGEFGEARLLAKALTALRSLLSDTASWPDPHNERPIRPFVAEGCHGTSAIQ
jgi:hypothetical protein